VLDFLSNQLPVNKKNTNNKQTKKKYQNTNNKQTNKTKTTNKQKQKATKNIAAD
jgi:hypothetical protein